MTETLLRTDNTDILDLPADFDAIEMRIREKISRHPGQATEDEIVAALTQGWLYGLTRETLSEQEMRAIAHVICSDESAKQVHVEDEPRYGELDFNRLDGDFIPVLDTVSLTAIAAMRHGRKLREASSASDDTQTAV